MNTLTDQKKIELVASYGRAILRTERASTIRNKTAILDEDRKAKALLRAMLDRAPTDEEIESLY